MLNVVTCSIKYSPDLIFRKEVRDGISNSKCLKFELLSMHAVELLDSAAQSVEARWSYVLLYKILSKLSSLRKRWMGIRSKTQETIYVS